MTTRSPLTAVVTVLFPTEADALTYSLDTKLIVLSALKVTLTVTSDAGISKQYLSPSSVVWKLPLTASPSESVTTTSPIAYPAEGVTVSLTSSYTSADDIFELTVPFVTELMVIL